MATRLADCREPGTPSVQPGRNARSPKHPQSAPAPQPTTEATCSGCGATFDPRGLHRAACTRSGRVRKRAAWHRCSGKPVPVCGSNAFLPDMNVRVVASVARRIEVLTQDLPRFGGSQLAVDVTLRSSLGSSGEPQPHTADVDWLRPTSAGWWWWPKNQEVGGAKSLWTSSSSWRLPKERQAPPAMA